MRRESDHVSGSESTASNHTSTFSVVGFDAVTGDLGIAVQSRYLAIGQIVPYARAGVGALATQAFARTDLGPTVLELLSDGMSPDEAIKYALADDPHRSMRQIAVIDPKGQAHAFTGSECGAWAGHRTGENCSVQGNLLVGEHVVVAMEEAFRETEGELAQRLLAALMAGQAAGGEIRGQQAAALLVVRRGGGYFGQNDRFIDLRVDDHPRPIHELFRLYRRWDRTVGIRAREASVKAFVESGNLSGAEVEKGRMLQRKMSHNRVQRLFDQLTRYCGVFWWAWVPTSRLLRKRRRKPKT